MTLRANRHSEFVTATRFLIMLNAIYAVNALWRTRLCWPELAARNTRVCQGFRTSRCDRPPTNSRQKLEWLRPVPTTSAERNRLRDRGP